VWAKATASKLVRCRSTRRRSDLPSGQHQGGVPSTTYRRSSWSGVASCAVVPVGVTPFSRTTRGVNGAMTLFARLLAATPHALTVRANPPCSRRAVLIACQAEPLGPRTSGNARAPSSRRVHCASTRFHLGGLRVIERANSVSGYSGRRIPHQRAMTIIRERRERSALPFSSWASSTEAGTGTDTPPSPLSRPWPCRGPWPCGHQGLLVRPSPKSKGRATILHHPAGGS